MEPEVVVVHTEPEVAPDPFAWVHEAHHQLGERIDSVDERLSSHEHPEYARLDHEHDEYARAEHEHPELEHETVVETPPPALEQEIDISTSPEPEPEPERAEPTKRRRHFGVKH